VPGAWSKRNGVVAAALAVAVGAALASTSAAGTSTAVVDLSPGEAGEAVAACKKGAKRHGKRAKRRVVFGGFETTPSLAADGSGPLVDTLVRPRRRKLQVGGANGGEEPGAIRAFAYCRRKAPTLHARSSTATVPALDEDFASVRCPESESVRFGGFEGKRAPDGAPGVVPTTMVLLGRRELLVYGGNLSDSDETITATAYCGEGSPLTEAIASTFVSPGDRGSATAVCPAGTRVAFGGFDIEFLGIDDATLRLRAAKLTSRRTWRVTAQNLSALDQGYLDAYAYCS
jgi:hypothetical protein